ncbi:hypothetical protein ADZ36_05760 [Streptomyces fradiae]|uniref:Uncharacterized protein n=3 Tax=Streptomyces TaxID=1883 RepID=A0A3M8EXL4_9ACTN|nr:hypothetical protein [Streptomyces xinghaiensis]KNE83397.1 hypothetical protein ADZ36_05760 [Streptomyces fradiae]OFA44239.1 hypothetical protein BEN35_22750 [Streptomyces fradiae]PQM20727.1 hypothetical protein Sfr7A_25660 [Streptomyces xinghaiensis]RKM92668.1 hypothetical protein SFRA_024315 [Streptomyces xinghaiensis]RNC70637.1 hypothetical protein DC095_025305 [Streptomyces xinghaiensis]
MTPLRTRHAWQLSFGETPRPSTLPRTFDVVRVGMGLGLPAIDAVIDSNGQVGPVLGCGTHRSLLIPVEAGTAHLWGAPHSVCDAGAALWCGTDGEPSFCHNRVWMSRPEPLAHPTTGHRTLHNHLSLMRDRMRSPRQLRCGAGTVCHP